MTTLAAGRRRPRVAILAAGRNRHAGDTCRAQQIIGSTDWRSRFPALRRRRAHDLGIAPDNRAACSTWPAPRSGRPSGHTGGASVGTTIWCARRLGEQGMAIDFWKIAMRPGKR